MDLGYSNTHMGLLQTGIVTGYLICAYLAGIFASRWNVVKVINLSAFIAGLAMAGLGAVSSFYSCFIFALLMGAGSSGAYIPLVPLIIARCSSKKSGFAMGLTFSGTGVGIILVGYLVPFLITQLGPQGWRWSWILLGAITLSTAFCSFLFLREPPEDVGRSPARHDDQYKGTRVWRLIGWNQLVRTILIVYVLVGFAKIIYQTFLVAYAVEEISITSTEAGFVWSIYGAFSIVGSFVWGTISDFLGRKSTATWNIMILCTSVFILVLMGSRLGLYISVILFSLSFNGFIAIIAAMFGDNVEVSRVGEVFGLSTLFHGLGQALGAGVGGYLKDLTSTFQTSFVVSGTTIGFCLLYFVFFYKNGGKYAMRASGKGSPQSSNQEYGS
jgi:MFS family permease